MRLLILPNSYIRTYTYALTDISYIYDLTRTYNITRTCRHPIFQYSDLLYHVNPYRSNAVYISLYGLIWNCTTYTTFNILNLSKVPGVTPTHFYGHISEWGQTLIEYTYLLVRITPMIISPNSLNRFPWSGLVIKYPVIPFMGHHSTVTYYCL